MTIKSRFSAPLYGILAFLLLVVQVMAVLCAFTKPAYAYVDPGSGLLAFQILSSTFAGAIFMVRKRLRNLFNKIHLEEKSHHAERK